MESTFNLLSLNYISNVILNNNDSSKLIINNLNEEDILKAINEIISHYLYNKEQVLIISNIEKSKTLSQKIFKALGKRSVDFHHNNDLNKKIKELLLDLHPQTGKTIISKIELINRDIKKKYEILSQINGLFLNKNINNISLIEKYEITERKIDNYDLSYKYYKSYRIKRPLNKYSYSEVKESCKNILSSSFISSYVKYKRFSDNDIFKCLIYPIDYNLLSETIEKINYIVSSKTINYNLRYSKYTNDFIDLYFLNDTMDEKYIASLSSIINLKYNHDLLSINKKNKWFNIFKKKKILEKEDKLNLFTSCQKEIYDEYINNYNSICSLKDNLSFLEEILNDGTYIETLRNIIRGEDVYEILKFYLRIFKVAYKTKIDLEIVDRLSPIEKDILNYCYDDLEEKKEINNLISYLPRLKLYLEIEEEEFKYNDIIKLYNQYDKIVEDIFNDIYIKESLLYNAINSVWDNQLKDSYSLLMENIKNLSIESINRFFPCVISNGSIEELDKLIQKKFYFKRIVVELNEYCILNENILNKLNRLGENIIIFSKSKNNSINDFKRINSIDLYNDYITSHNESIVINEINNFLIDKELAININVKGDYLEILKNDSEKKIIVIVSPSGKDLNYDILLNDIYKLKYYRENDAKIYRVWYRDWWIDKYREYTKIEKYIKEI
ncbi:hypothetical protein ACQPVP_07250 [Clostridium nigeriense]|uniref:hypothetical protein n=1 Tax=Clostridium nigeriense TaxID=1805470 RepID=UPI003D33B0B8